MQTDFLLASGHHVLLLILVSMLAGEAAVLRQAPTPAALRSLSRLDRLYGASAAALLAVGVSRLFWGAKPAAFYAANPAFWLKLGAFLLVGAISVVPTLAFIRWGRAVRADPAWLPDAAQWAKARRLAIAQLHLLAVVVIAAAAMARGIGYL